MRAAKAQMRLMNEFEQSNSTTNAFIGRGTQKAWMKDRSPEAARGSSTSKVSMPKSPDQVSIDSSRTELTPEAYKAGENGDPRNTAFGPDFDRGRYPAKRPRRGSTINFADRPLISPATGSTPPVLEENPYTPQAIANDNPSNTENVLPSPSPSVDARQNSVNAVESEVEGHQPQTAEAQSIENPAAALEELVRRCGGIEQLEKLFRDAGNSNHGRPQLIESAAARGLLPASPSSGLRPQGQPPGSKNHLRSESDHDVSAPSINNKRPQETMENPRKRLQSLPSSIPKETFATLTATTMSQNQNGQSSAAASPSLMEMRPFFQNLTQRTQLVVNLPGREGSHVERPRLGLLREACENSDHFYLVLHQLFCFDHVVRKSSGQVPGLNETHRKGLNVVKFLLVENEKMLDDAVAWFSAFPLPLGELIVNRPEFASAYSKVLRCLERMAAFWTDMRSQCKKRIHPPLVDEIVVLFNIESFLFQQIIFRAILRDIWSGQQDDCFFMIEKVFNRDYKEVMRRLSSGNVPVELVKLYQEAVIKEYRHALVFHRQHTAAGSTVSMAPPLQQQNQLRPSPTNHQFDNRNESQSGHDRNTRSPLTLNLHAARRHSLSAASGTASMNVQAIQNGAQGNLLIQSQVLASNPFPSPQDSTFTQSPTALQGFLSPGASINSPVQWSNQQHQRERRASSTTGNSFSILNNLQNPPPSTTLSQRTPRVVSNAPANPHMHQLQQNIGHQQQSHGRLPSPNTANPRTRPHSEVRRSLSNQACETSLPAQSPHSFIYPSPSLPIQADPTPFIRNYPPLPAHPNPTTSALHQAHLRSPTLSYVDPNDNRSDMAKCYRFIKHVLMPPEELDSKNRLVNWDFSVNKELTDWFARDTIISRGAPPNRGIVPGSRLCRIRCISLKNEAGMPSQNEWAVADNVWPGSTAVVLNGIALDIRRKTHHGKDLPIDVTPHIKAGQNNLSTAVIGFPKDSTTRYAIGVEFIQVADEQKIKDEMKPLPWFEARQRLLDQSKNLDPEIEIVQSQKVVDLTDPFTARIFAVPMRGVDCHHNQCFDRDTFLHTRTVKVPGEPCGPDEFRCPICGQDARPQSLVIDTFFVGVRMALKERGRLDAKAIILHDSGDWEIKEEEEVTGESGDGTGRMGLAAAKQSAPREVIELDDD